MLLKINSGLIYIIVIFILVQIENCSALKCYICRKNNSETCSNEDLKECPSHRAYDRCRLWIQYKENNLVQYLRDCALGPCHFKNKDYETALQLDHKCQIGQDCVHCCKTDGCNFSSDSWSNIVPPSIGIILITSLIMKLFIN